MGLSITFDTLAFCKTLQNAGMEQKQAEAFAAAHQQAMNELVEAKDLAAKRDIERLELKIKEMEIRLLKWQIGIGFALVAIMAKGFGWLGF